MFGRFTVSLHDAKDDRPYSLHEARKLPLSARAYGSNLVFDNFSSYVFRHLFNGPSVDAPYEGASGDGSCALGFLALLSTDAAPTYTEASNETVAPNSVTDVAGGDNCAKRFVEDQLERSIVSATNGREAVTMNMAWMWLQDDGNSSAIKSLGIFHSQNADADGSTVQTCGRIARIRLTDIGGTPITYTKTAGKVLIVDYAFTLVSV